MEILCGTPILGKRSNLVLFSMFPFVVIIKSDHFRGFVRISLVLAYSPETLLTNPYLTMVLVICEENNDLVYYACVCVCV